jgi:nucleoid DNA-binding protein
MAVLGKSEIVDALVRLTGETRQSCEKNYVAMVQLLQDGMLTGHEFKIQGLGVFTTRMVSGKTMVNPSTGETQEVKPRLAPTIRWSGAYKKKFRQDEE